MIGNTSRQTNPRKSAIYFPVKWAYWLARALPGAKDPVELKGARLFFPEERADESINCSAGIC